ncbi:winged helix-turn-helix domain-containing protein [Gorillibacterium sp. sgz500922]|uniref:winged helix-turn-helix domain-containing protein n=1 Tax=Gorillibacterium sp. sgz500922 TaxID=3446694 RepID=UPI003F673736
MDNRMGLTVEEARRFLLLKHGLAGEYRFKGKAGILEFVRQAGCIQYDPIDVCGKNAELVLQARVPDFTKPMLEELLYRDRRLVDYFDKNLAILPIEDWPYFSRTREQYRTDSRSRELVERWRDDILAAVRGKAGVFAKDLGLKESVDWYWSPSSLGRAALETLYFRGDLVVHHKKGTAKAYGAADEWLDPALLAAPDPNGTEESYRKWQVERRVGAVGLLWNKPSDAWLGIRGLKSAERMEAFAALLAEGRLVEVQVEGMREPLYLRQEDLSLAERAKAAGKLKQRVEFIAPLDNLLWDRKLIKALFDFEYKWEIYTPAAERRYGYYVLPVLYGTRFAGRIELIAHKKRGELELRRFWPEPDFPGGAGFDRALAERLERFAAFHGCGRVFRET